jgi:hypothetical protein
MKHADRVRAAADAGHHGVGQLACLRQHLFSGFVADDRLGTRTVRKG